MSADEPLWRRWVAKAESDLLNIQNNLNPKFVPWDTICFHSHQAAGKSFKAFLISRSRSAPRVHDLVVLLEACSSCEPQFKQLEEDWRHLNLVSIRSRYPDDFAEPIEQLARAAMRNCDRISSLVRDHLPKV